MGKKKSGKKKSKKGPIADKRLVKKDAAKKQQSRINPFEIRINKQKHDTLGKKLKCDKGFPGIKRNKAFKKRKETLLNEYVNKDKANLFLDKRIGEKDSTMDYEDKIAARMARERKKMLKANVFNLNESEDLTHMGESVMNLDKFDEPFDPSDDEEDKLDAKFVSDAHFGGGFMTKKENDKSHKDHIEELIAQTKVKRHERQTEKEENEELIDKLESDWKNVQHLVTQMKRKKEEEDAMKNEKKGDDDYDMKVRELQFEARGKASDPLKTQEEIAKAEKIKLEKLEAERRQRMMGDVPQTKKALKHVSADSLEDNFDTKFQHSPEAEPEEENEETSEVNEEKVGSDSDEDAQSEEDASSDEDTGSEDEYSDLDSDEEDDEEIEIKKKPTKKSENKVKSKLQTNDIPFIIEAPVNYEDFANLVKTRSAGEQAVIVSRIIKSNHPSLGENNKTKLETLFAIIVQHFNNLAKNCTDGEAFSIIDALVPSLFQLSELNPTVCAQVMSDVFSEHYEKFCQFTKKSFGKVTYPKLDVIIMFKLVSILYSTSDNYHHITTPAFIFMSHLLSACGTSTAYDVQSGLLICNILLEYVTYSKRVIPEALNYLHHLLQLASEPKIEAPCGFLPNASYSNFDLFIRNDATSERPQKLKLSSLLKSPNDLLEFTVSVVACALKLTAKFATLYEDQPSYKELFQRHFDSCMKLPVENYPAELKSLVDGLENQLLKEKKLSVIIREKKKPQPMKQFTPKFEEVFDGRKHSQKSKEKKEQDKLVYKHKREMKGAIREIRRDNQFFAKHWQQQQIDKDAERKRKVNKLYQDLAQQECEFKKTKKKR